MPFIFSPPGGLPEMNDDAARAWHTQVSGYMARSAETPDETFGGPRSQFFNPADGVESDAVTREVDWFAFPLPITTGSASDEERWILADESRHVQIEYCEWSVERMADGRIRKISFTCEDGSYFSTLAQHQPDMVLDIYRQHVSQDVSRDDIFSRDGEYLVENKWNANTRTGAMHMIARPNTIGAAVELVAAATVVRSRADGTLITGAQEITRCGGSADPARHSDPTIYENVNELARAGHTLSLADPPELAFASIDFSGWEVPEGLSASDVFKFTRGSAGHHQRAVLEIPAETGFSVSDIVIDGEAIRYGGQVADKIRIKVAALAHRLGQATVTPLAGCLGEPSPGAGLAPPSSALARRALFSR